jgi:hypothetical protein
MTHARRQSPRECVPHSTIYSEYSRSTTDRFSSVCGVCAVCVRCTCVVTLPFSFSHSFVTTQHLSHHHYWWIFSDFRKKGKRPPFCGALWLVQFHENRVLRVVVVASFCVCVRVAAKVGRTKHCISHHHTTKEIIAVRSLISVQRNIDYKLLHQPDNNSTTQYNSYHPPNNNMTTDYPSPVCSIDRDILNADTLPEMTDIGLSFFAAACGKNRGAWVLDPPDGQTYSWYESEQQDCVCQQHRAK